MKCPGFERLIDYLDGRLSGDESGQVAMHLSSGCNRCETDRRWYERVRSVAAGDDSVEPPPWVFKRALRIYDSQRTRPRLVERFGQLIAALIFDSSARTELAGVRSTETVNRQLLYRAGDYSIDLQVAPAGQSRADLIGQVLKEEEAGFGSVTELSVELLCRGEVVDLASTNDMGEFTINRVELGVYDLQVKTPEGSITISGLPITQSL